MAASYEEPADFLHSSLREKLLEHVFIAELLKSLWRRGRRDIEVLRAEVDRGGYDVVVDCGNVCRHIQLKATRAGSQTKSVNINTALSSKPSGCVVWMVFDPSLLNLGPFLWFGAEPGQALPDLGTHIARHTRGDKAERPALRVLHKSRFSSIDSMDELIRALFGALEPITSAASPRL
jgi:hypothetical protein